MCNVTDACQSLATKAIGGDRLEVFEGLELRSREPLAENGQIISLSSLSKLKSNLLPCSHQSHGHYL